MEFETVYKVTDNYWFLLLGLIPLIIFVFGILTIFKPDFLGEDTPKILRRIISFIIVIVSLYANIFFILGVFNNYNQIVKSYKNNDFIVLEGEISDFIPGYKHGDIESFSINGIYFEYLPATANFGYRKYASKGGCIKGNGQYVRIGYVYSDYENTNIIVLIQLLITNTT